MNDSRAIWVDSKNNAATTSLRKLAPSQRTLDRIRVARAFTAFQHYSLIEDLTLEVTEETSLVVVPAIDWFYANDDLCKGEGETMLTHALDILSDLAPANDIPVLLSRHSNQGLGTEVEPYCDEVLECTNTRFGPRFEGEEFETLLFDCNNGVQTTLAFWRRVIEQRHPTIAPNGAAEVTRIGSH
jgi:hypothetical protein